MTTFLMQLTIAWVALIVLHTSALALCGVMFGVHLREISFGFGSIVVKRGLLTIRATPLGGFVKFKDTRSEELTDDDAGAYNHQPRLVQAIIPLAGCAALVLVAFFIAPASALLDVISGFRQIIGGALSPFSTAQQYIHAGYEVASQAGFIALLGLLAAKFAAFNLLPFPWTNGGQAILAVLRADRTSTPRWQERLNPIARWAFLLLVLSWTVSFGTFVAHGA